MGNNPKFRVLAGLMLAFFVFAAGAAWMPQSAAADGGWTEWADQWRGHQEYLVLATAEVQGPGTLTAIFEQHQLHDEDGGNCAPQVNEIALVSIAGQTSFLFDDGVAADRIRSATLSLKVQAAGSYALDSTWDGHPGEPGCRGNGSYKVRVMWFFEPDPEPTFSLAVEAGCSAGFATGHADVPAMLVVTGTDAAGNNLTIGQEVEGPFAVSFDMSAPEELGEYPVGLTASLIVDDQVVITASFVETLSCGEPPEPEPDLYTVAIEATCDLATVTGFAEKAATITVSGTDAAGEPVSFWQEVEGAFAIQVPLTSPEKLGDYEISLSATLTGPTGSAAAAFSDTITCGEPAEMCHGTAKINFDMSGVGMKPGRYTISGQGMNNPVPEWIVSEVDAALYAHTGGPLDTEYKQFSLRQRRATYVEVVYHDLNGNQEKLVVLNWAPDPAYQGIFGWVSCDVQHSIEVAWAGVAAAQAAAWTAETNAHVTTTAQVLGWYVAEAEVVIEEATDAETPAAAVANDGTYTVVAGDTLSAIAYAAGQDWRQMAEWNGLDVLDGNIVVLSIGQVIFLAPPGG